MAEPENEHEHISSLTLLGSILAALLVLTGATVGVSYLDLGFFNVPIALFIASSKATLVLLFFMHLKYEGKAVVVSFTSTVIFLGIMITFIFWDLAYR